jgi:AraC family transcriptional regulator
MREGTSESYQERILRAQVHLQQHLDEPLSLEELARVACFSPYHFHRIFRGMVGESVKEHIRRLRLERAALRLKTTSESVTQLAFDAGYESHEAFTRAFGEMFGVSPSQFRELSSARAEDRTKAAARMKMTGAAVATPLEVRIESLGPLRLAFVRHVGPYDQVSAAWARLIAWATVNRLFGPTTRAIGVVHDDPEITPPERLRYDAAIPAPDSALAEGEIGIQEIPQTDYATTLHRGPYSELGRTYARLCGEWLPASGCEPISQPALEIYHNAPQWTRPEDLLTSIYLPLEH